MNSDEIRRLKERADKIHDEYVEAVVDVMCASLKEVMAYEVSDRLREKIYDAIRFEI